MNLFKVVQAVTFTKGEESVCVTLNQSILETSLLACITKRVMKKLAVQLV